jgi:uncharacterized protein (UPF0303 family)
MTDDERRVIASLDAQEQQLVFTRFDNGDAWQLGSAMVAAATKRSLPVTIDIRRHGQQLFHAALPDTTPENDSWIERKVNVVNRFAASSYLVGRRLAASGTALVQWHALVGASDYLNMSDSTWPGGDPERGNLEPSVLGALCAVFAEHTATHRRACSVSGMAMASSMVAGRRSPIRSAADGQEAPYETHPRSRATGRRLCFPLANISCFAARSPPPWR